MVAKSSVEAEFRAMAHKICELLRLKILVNELGYDYKDPMRLYCNNKAASILLIIWFSMTKLNTLKFIDILLRKNCKQINLYTRYEDWRTKGVSNNVLQTALCKMDMWDIFAFARGEMLKKET